MMYTLACVFVHALQHLNPTLEAMCASTQVAVLQVFFDSSVGEHPQIKHIGFKCWRAMSASTQFAHVVTHTCVVVLGSRREATDSKILEGLCNTNVVALEDGNVNVQCAYLHVVVKGLYH